MPRKRLVVIGGGAAGFFCAVNAARMNSNLEVIIVERSAKLLSKVKVSGGGRCNTTHACFDIDEMSRRYPRGGNFIKKTFHQFFTTDTIEWFRERGVELKTEKDGRMFPVTDNSQTIIDCLLREAERFEVEIRIKTEVRKISQNTDGGFILEFADGKNSKADFICIASGGYPKKEMFEWLTSLGHTIETPVPSLFTFNLPKHPITELMGVVADNVKVRIANSKMEQTGPLLITHWGLSGPAILKLSAWGAREFAALNYNFSVRIKWLGSEENEHTLKPKWQQYRNELASRKILSQNVSGLPKRLWEFLVNQSRISNETRFADLTAKSENLLIKNLIDYTADVYGKTTFKEEFVTAGGIKLSEIDHLTMMSKKLPGIYFAGEVMDVDGITGGYNFQHAWTSGFIAAKSIAAS